MNKCWDNQCRYVDLLLRAKFPHLKTRIFATHETLFEVHFSCPENEFRAIEKVFEQSIKPVTLPIKLRTTLPDTYLREIFPLEDQEVGSTLEGWHLPKYQFLTLLRGIHRDIKILDVQDNPSTRTLQLILDQEASKESEASLLQTLNDLNLPLSVEIIRSKGKEHELELSIKSGNIIAPAKSYKTLNLPFVERDEALWFDNYKKIYRGEFKKEEIPFFEPEQTSCLVNCATFKNINLRNHLLLYDTIYCILPLVEYMDDFLQDQQITREEILYLVEKSRLKFLVFQPEIRQDVDLLREAYSICPDSIASRRALSALCAIDIVDTNTNYILNAPELQDILPTLISSIAEVTGEAEARVAQMLLWPRTAYRASLDILTFAGPIGISQFGTNNPICSGFSGALKENAEFEFIVNSAQIHISHALDATYFPFFSEDEKYSDYVPSSYMGCLLNSFRQSTTDMLNGMRPKESDEPLQQNPNLNLINIFDVSTYIGIEEFCSTIEKQWHRKTLRSLFSQLSKLDPDERNNQIQRYNKDVRDMIGRQKGRDIAVDLTVEGAGMVTGIPFLGQILNAGAAATKFAISKHPQLQKTYDQLAEKVRGRRPNKEVSLLSKINRVARLKKTYS